MQKLAYTRNGKEYAIVPTSDPTDAIALLADAFGVPVASIEYLLQYGHKQSLQDAAAQPASEASKESDATPESIASAIDGAMSKRLDAIVAGTVAVRGGGVRVTDPFESMVRAVIDEILAKSAKKSGKKLPKGDELIALRGKVRAANTVAVESEARKRLAAVSAVEVDFDM